MVLAASSNFAAACASPSATIIYAASFALGLLVMIGINIPDGTAAQLVGAIYAKDWGALVTLAFANIIDPIVRYFLDRKNTREAAIG